MEEEGFSN